MIKTLLEVLHFVNAPGQNQGSTLKVQLIFCIIIPEENGYFDVNRGQISKLMVHFAPFAPLLPQPRMQAADFPIT